MRRKMARNAPPRRSVVPAPEGVVAFVAPTAAAARRCRLAVGGDLPAVRVRPMALGQYATDVRVPLRIVLCPPGESVEEDVRFLREARRTILWPPPGAELWSAIAGLRGSHDAPPSGAVGTARKSGRRAALLLEGDVTVERARRAAASGAPRDWIVERVQRVRIGAKGLDELEHIGIRWAVLEPVEVIALAASAALARARSRWAKWLPNDVPVWTLAGSPKSNATAR